MDACICMAESISCSPETATTSFVDQLAIPQYKKFLFFLSNKLSPFAIAYVRTQLDLA